jgi:hypothetical protein
MVSFEALNFLIQESRNLKREDMITVAKHPDLTFLKKLDNFDLAC